MDDVFVDGGDFGFGEVVCLQVVGYVVELYQFGDFVEVEVYVLSVLDEGELFDVCVVVVVIVVVVVWLVDQFVVFVVVYGFYIDVSGSCQFVDGECRWCCI